ncbi:MAG: hypothetical protein HOY69_18130 [Streptomyces sp.]|nr:hypothetical protein [Streptomyces sp.]
MRPATAAMGVLTCACVVASGCGTAGTGARNEGPAASPSTRASSTASAPAIARNKRALATMVRRDASVSRDVREDLTPCASDDRARGARGSKDADGPDDDAGTATAGATPSESPTTSASAAPDGDDDDYPVAIDSGDLTSGDGPDLVVNVTTCGNGLGVAAYVYRMVNGKYLNVFADERPPVYGSVTDGQLEIIHEVYKVGDPVSFPTVQESVRYAWRGGRFVQVAREYADFGSKTPTVVPEPTSTDPAPRPDADPVDPDLPTATATESAPPATPGGDADAGASATAGAG